jgi:hypothetical protein
MSKNLDCLKAWQWSIRGGKDGHSNGLRVRIMFNNGSSYELPCAIAMALQLWPPTKGVTLQLTWQVCAKHTRTSAISHLEMPIMFLEMILLFLHLAMSVSILPLVGSTYTMFFLLIQFSSHTMDTLMDTLSDNTCTLPQ